MYATFSRINLINLMLTCEAIIEAVHNDMEAYLIVSSFFMKKVDSHKNVAYYHPECCLLSE